MIKGFWGSLFLFVFISLKLGTASATLSCRVFLEPESKAISTFSREAPLRFMSYNVFNLYLHKGKYIWTEEGLERVNQDHLPKQKPEVQTQGVAKAILDLNPDFLLLQEVEGLNSLERFNRNYLEDGYEIMMSPTNDAREIGIAFLVKKTLSAQLKLRIELESFTDLKWKSPSGRREPVFSRDFPIFKIYREGQAEPSLILGGIHFKSQRDRKGDPNSYYKRQAEMRAAVHILETVKKEHPTSPIVVMGDFNASRGDNEVTPVFERLGLFDTHLSEAHFVDVAGLGHNTHTYHPHVNRLEQTAVKTVLDRALISQRLVESVIKSAVYRYRVEGSNERKPLPNSLAERIKNPSDHYPIYFDLDSSVLSD